MIAAVVNIQQFINRRSVKYEPFGPWNHFPEIIFGQNKFTVNSDSESESEDEDKSNSGGSDNGSENEDKSDSGGSDNGSDASEG